MGKKVQSVLESKYLIRKLLVSFAAAIYARVHQYASARTSTRTRTEVNLISGGKQLDTKALGVNEKDER